MADELEMAVLQELVAANRLRERQAVALEHIVERLEVCNERTNERLAVIARCLGALGRE